MQVSVEAGEGTERTLKIQVPAETLNQEVENRLKSMKGQVKIDGFRPGKVPLKVVKQRYGVQVFQEIAGEMIQNTFRDALTQENLKPVGDPVIDAQSMAMGEPLEYTATFDVIEEFTLSPVADIKLEQLEAEISDTDVDNMIDTLRQQRVTWSEEDRAAKDGDKVTISFKGSIDGEAFAGGEGKDTGVILGTGSMIPGFEDQLIGLSKSASATIKVTFPSDYNTQELASKEAEFEVEVSKVESSVLPEVDDDFVKTFGVEDGGVDALKVEIKKNMERELGNRIRADLKTKVMDRLVENNDIAVPNSAIQEEAVVLQKQASEMMQGQEVPVEGFIEEATKRVKLGNILAKVVSTAELAADETMVRDRIDMMSKDYADPEEFVNHYLNNQQLLQTVQGIVMEDMIVDWVVDAAVVTKVKTTFDELMNQTK